MANTVYLTDTQFSGTLFVSPPSVNELGYYALPTTGSPYMGTAIPAGSPVSLVAITFTPGANTYLYSGTTVGTLALKDSSGATIVQGGANTLSDTSTGASTVMFSNSFNWPSNTNLTLYGATGSDYFFRYLPTGSGMGNMRIAVSVNYTPITACSPPTTCTATPNPAESAATLAWSGAGSGANNAINGYGVQYCESSDGNSWGSWINYTTVVYSTTSASLEIPPHSTRGYYRKYRVRTQGAAGSSYYSGWKESNSVRKNRVPTGPTSFSVSPAIWTSGALSLTWSGQSDADGNLSGVALEYQINSGAWTSLGTKTSSPFSYTPSLSSGQTLTFRARAVDALSVYADSYRTSNTVSTYSAATAPTACSLSVTLTETTATLSWSGAAAGMENAISGYEIQYCESSNNSTWGSWTAYSTVSATATSGSATVNASSTRGYYRKFRVRTQGSAGSSYYSGWKESTNTVRKNQLPANPTALAVTPAIWTSGALSVSWSGQSDPDSNLSGVVIEYQVNSGTWVSLGTKTSSPLSYTPSLTSGQTLTFRARSVDAFTAYADTYKTSNTVKTYSAATAPTTCGLGATLVESAATLSWSGAAAGMENAISGYEIQYCESSDNSAWSSWTGYSTVSGTATSGSASVDASSTRGYYRKFRVRTQGSAGSSYYSGWKESANTVRKNQLPTNPTTFTVAPAVWQSGALALAWSGQTDPDNNLTGITIEYQINEAGAWTSIGSFAGTSATYTPTLSIGQTITFRAQAYDALNAVAATRKTSNTVISNTPPAAPTINYPAANATCYCATPRVLITVGADAEGNSQALSASGYTPSRAGNLAPGQKIVYKRTSALSSGSTQTFSITATDTGGLASSSATRGYKYVVPSYNQPTLTAGATKIKAVDINEMRAMISNLCAYYGLAAPSWGGDVVANSTSLAGWTNHIKAIRTQVENIANRVNGWDTASVTNRIILPAWTTISKNMPTAAVMNQLRVAIALL